MGSEGGRQGEGLCFVVRRIGPLLLLEVFVVQRQMKLTRGEDVGAEGIERGIAAATDRTGGDNGGEEGGGEQCDRRRLEVAQLHEKVLSGEPLAAHRVG